MRAFLEGGTDKSVPYDKKAKQKRRYFDDMKMEMSNDEIVMRYRQAKDKNEQIGILADLNACKKDVIMAILVDEGAITGLPKRKAKTGTTANMVVQRPEDNDIIRWYEEGLSGSQIAERIGWLPNRVNVRIRKLSEAGLLEKRSAKKNTEKRNTKKYSAPKDLEKVTSVPDTVAHPQHYTVGNIECIEYIKDKLSEDEFRGYIKGNVIKYITREAYKNKTEDLKKAQWYLNYYLDGPSE